MTEPKWIELQKSAAWCVKDLLTAVECEQAIREATEAGIMDKRPQGDLRHRCRVEVSVENSSIPPILWERVKDKVPQEVVVSKDDAANPAIVDAQDCIGTWRPSSVTSSLRVHYCTGAGHLAAHRDGPHILSEHERSFVTINGYLNPRPRGTGGATRFLKDDIVVGKSDDNLFIVKEEDVIMKVEADKAGKAIVFLHGLMHDGEPLEPDSPPKWLYRVMVNYRRDPDTAPKLTADEQMARDLIKQAEEAECKCKIQDAIRLYNRAYKLDPTLER